MNIFVLLFSLSAISAVIPVSSFDQSKLETLLRKIPSAYIETHKDNGVIRKTYIYPAEGPLIIHCYADYFESAPVPTYKTCTIEVSVGRFESIVSEKKGDEFKVRFTDPEMVNEMSEAITFGSLSKEVYSHERVYGLAFEGIWRNLFRFRFSCLKKACEVTFTPKPYQL